MLIKKSLKDQPLQQEIMKEVEKRLVSSFFFFALAYRKLTEACQTKAKRKKSIGITGKISTNGLKGAYASGNLANKIFVK